MGRLILIRHGQSEGNRDGCFTPHPDIPLTERGREQARAAATLIAERFAPARVVSSPFLRARQTAEILATGFGLDVAVHRDLRERSYGELAGFPYSTPRVGYDPSAYWTWRPPGGETLDEVLARAGAVLDGLASDAPDLDVVVVSHGAVMLALARHVRGEWGTGGVVGNAGMLVVEHENGAWGEAKSLDAESIA